MKVKSARSFDLLSRMLAPFVECYWFLGAQLPALLEESPKERQLVSNFFNVRPAASRGADGACLTPTGDWGQVAASNAGLLHSQIYSAVSTRAYALPPAL